jgi:hypothetical protein
MKKVLESLAREIGQYDKGERGTIRDSRLLFGDDIVSQFFVQATEGDEALANVHPDIEAAISALMRFTNAALDEWFVRARGRGAEFHDLGDGPLLWPPGAK